jgi:osmotically inducible protein OsmC
VTLEQVEGGFGITAVHLTLKGKVPGMDAAAFQAVAEKAKAGCPLSKVIRAPITMDASLA